MSLSIPHRPKRGVQQLPPEILAEIVSYAPTARTLRNLSLSSKSLKGLVEKEGWRAFVQRRFPSFNDLPPWRDAAIRLTSLSRAFDRKAIIASYVHLDSKVYGYRQQSRPAEGRQHHNAQTVGFQPVIDSYECSPTIAGPGQEEILCWGAGPDLFIKRQVAPQSDNRRHSSRQRSSRATTIGHYRESGHIDGRDDITTLNLLRPNQYNTTTTSNAAETQVVIGQANSELSLLSGTGGEGFKKLKQFDTEDAPVRAAHVSSSGQPLLAACLGDQRVSIYGFSDESSNAKIAPSDQIEVRENGTRLGTRNWTVRFISRERLAIGRGISQSIVHVYAARPEGLSRDPIRIFDAVDPIAKRTTVYPITELPSSAMTNEPEGTLFFTGGHDGTIRLHDMRSASNAVAWFADPTHYAPIYSMTLVGRERIMAGTAVNSLLKVFDIRMPGGRNYSYLDTMIDNGQSSIPITTSQTTADMYESGWNLYTFSQQGRLMPGYRRSRESSPIYSISHPSSSSPSFYIGQENLVTRIDMSCAIDTLKDPTSAQKPNRRAQVYYNTRIHPQSTILNLGMFTHKDTKSIKANHILLQSDITAFKMGDLALDGLDERWISL